MGIRPLRRFLFVLVTLAGSAGFSAAASAKDCMATKTQGECKGECSWDKKKKSCAAKPSAKTNGKPGAAAAKAGGVTPPAKGVPSMPAAPAAAPKVGGKDKGKPKAPDTAVGKAKPGSKPADAAAKAKPTPSKPVEEPLPMDDEGPIGDEDF